MTLLIKPGNLFEEQEFEEFQGILRSRQGESDRFEVYLEYTKDMSLSMFNALVQCHMRLRRAGKSLQFSNAQEPVQNFVDKTRFYHVFA